MKNQIVSIITGLLIILMLSSCGQNSGGQNKSSTSDNTDNKTKTAFVTSKYAGTYSFGDDVKKGPVGSFAVYPESDSTILFYIDVCRGAPSYNLGQVFDRLVIKDDSALYLKREAGYENGCKLKMNFKGDELIIETVEGFNECGFGGNVYADNTYHRTDKNIPKYFVTGEGDTITFKNMTPEKFANMK